MNIKEIQGAVDTLKEAKTNIDEDKCMVNSKKVQDYRNALSVAIRCMEAIIYAESSVALDMDDWYRHDVLGKGGHVMNKGKDFEIDKEVYERALNNNNYISSVDMPKLFDASYLCGYGVYGAKAYEKDGKYWCSWYMGSSCD